MIWRIIRMMSCSMLPVACCTPLSIVLRNYSFIKRCWTEGVDDVVSKRNWKSSAVGLTSFTLPVESRFSELLSDSLGKHYLVFSKEDPKNELGSAVWLLRGQAWYVYQGVKLFYINIHPKNILHFCFCTPLKNYQLFALFFLSAFFFSIWDRGKIP